jgi:hypothetical protein
MKLKKEFGSDAVRDIIREAQLRAATAPEKTVRDPWPDDRLLVASTQAAAVPTKQDK